jgi:hypothetical protein
LEKEGYDEKKFPECKIPEEIFTYLKSKDWTNNFFFISWHRSFHDEEVISRTQAEFLKKENMKNTLEEIAKRLSA